MRNKGSEVCGLAATATVDGTVAIRMKPENTETEILDLIFPASPPKKAWQSAEQETETKVGLEAEGNAVELQAELPSELKGKEKFGGGIGGPGGVGGEGPFWHVGGAKLPLGTKKAVTGSLSKAASLYAKIGFIWLKITCAKGEPSGSIFNGTEHGEGEGTTKFKECGEVEESTTGKTEGYTKVAGCKVSEPITTSQFADALWYLATNVGKTRTGKVQLLFAPKTGTVLVNVLIPEKAECGVLGGVKLTVLGNTVAEMSPEFAETKAGKLYFPVEQHKHVWLPKNSPEETQVELVVEKTEADLVAEANVELTNGERFGVFES